MRRRAVLALVLAVLLTWAAPLLGLLAAGRPVDPYLDFPPRAPVMAHTPFD